MSDYPKVTFLFPYRWLKEDKEFLKANIERMIKKQCNASMLSEMQEVPLYKVEIHYQYKQPITSIGITKAQMEKLLKPILPYGKCMGLFLQFQQHTSQTMLPLMDFRLYYK